MRGPSSSVSKGLRIVMVSGIAVVLLAAFGGLGTARADHTSCGTYCWNVYAPYPGPDGTPYSQSGSGNSANIQADPTNGILETSQQSSASTDQLSEFYAEPYIEGDPIDFYTSVGVTFTFSTVVEASYSISGSCTFGENSGVVEVWVTAGLYGTSYTTTTEVFEAQQPQECVFSPHGSGTQAASVNPDISGGWGGTVNQVVSDDISSGIYTPYVQVTALTYAEVDGLGSVTSSLNMETGGYYAQWISLNINWGPGEG
jgi:hypothetical protein